MPGIGVNLRVTGHCSQGGRKYMEDMFSVAYQQTVDLKDLEYAFFGIFDGHGGPQAAKFAKAHLLDSIVNQRSFWSNDDEDVLRAIRDGYIATHYAMWKDLEKWPKTTTGLPSTSGSTATIAFIMKGKIYIGHVGDTAIVLGYQDQGEREWKAKVLTKDHKPECKEEKDRIEQSGGKVVNKSGVPRVVWNRPRLGHQGPVRRSTPIDEIPFLAVARSLGDFWSYNSGLDQFVVSPEPDVLVYPVDILRFRCLVLGTDGLWNMMTPKRAVTIVQATEIHNEKQVLYGPNSQYNKEWVNPSKTLVERALERWLTTKLRADNTSVVTLLLDPPGPPRAQVLLKQINKWRKSETAVPQEESNISVPKSGGMAIFTQYPPSQESVSITSDESLVGMADLSDKERNTVQSVEKSVEPIAADKPDKEGDEDNFDSISHIDASVKHASTYVMHMNRLEEMGSEEDASSDAENERIFPDCEPKKRRLSLDKKCMKPGTLRRPSLPALNGKINSLCKSKSLEESTRMLRSAAPMKTLRSRNIDLSDIGSSVSAKRSLASSPLTIKRQRLDEQRCTSSPVTCKKKLKTIEPKAGFLKSLLGHGESDLFCDADSKILGDVSLPISNKRNYQRMSAFSSRLRDRKHKSLSPLMMSKWRDSAVSHRDISSDGKARSVSDSELSPMLSSLVTHTRRMREQRGPMSMSPPKRKFKAAMSTLTQRSMTLRQSTDSLLGRVNDTCNVSKSVQN